MMQLWAEHESPTKRFDRVVESYGVHTPHLPENQKLVGRQKPQPQHCGGLLGRELRHLRLGGQSESCTVSWQSQGGETWRPELLHATDSEFGGIQALRTQRQVVRGHQGDRRGRGDLEQPHRQSLRGLIILLTPLPV